MPGRRGRRAGRELLFYEACGARLHGLSALVRPRSAIFRSGAVFVQAYEGQVPTSKWSRSVREGLGPM
ncbi:hypothetical protein JCM18897A_33160 [Streptomyces sp. JCM 18897]